MSKANKSNRRAWAQDTTMYIEPTSDVRKIRLKPEWERVKLRMPIQKATPMRKRRPRDD